MSKSPPYVPFYYGDFLRSTAGWTLLERGGYWMLLASEWEVGPLPDDPARLAAILGVDSATFASLWNIVRKKFKSTPEGLINERLEEHRSNFLEWRRKQSAGGKKGAAKRWHKDCSTVVPFQSRRDEHE